MSWEVVPFRRKPLKNNFKRAVKKNCGFGMCSTWRGVLLISRPWTTLRGSSSCVQGSLFCTWRSVVMSRGPLRTVGSRSDGYRAECLQAIGFGVCLFWLYRPTQGTTVLLTVSPCLGQGFTPLLTWACQEKPSFLPQVFALCFHYIMVLSFFFCIGWEFAF